MRETTYTDPDGFKYLVQLPDGVSDSQAGMGVVIGPPFLDDLKLPKDVAVRINNQLFARRLFTKADIRKRRIDAVAALQAALGVYVEKLVELY